MRLKTLGRSKGFYSIPAILYGVGFLFIAIAIAVAMRLLGAEKLNAGLAPSQLFSQHLISFANLLLIGSACLYASHLLVTARVVGQMASGMAAIGAMGVTVALLIRCLEASPVSQTHAPFSSLYDVTAIFSAVTVAIYLAMEKVYRTRAAGVFVMPIVVAAILLESSLISDGQADLGYLTPALKVYWIYAYILINIIGYGAFAVAAALGGMYLLKERSDRRFRTPGIAARLLPDLQPIDNLMFKAIALGTVAFTLGMMLGMAWSYQTSSVFWPSSRLQISALCVWSAYMIYFYGHYRGRWHGRWSAWLAILGFGISLHCFAEMNLFFSSAIS